MLTNKGRMNTRERLLQLLLSRKHCTISELADQLKINPISVRHHINKLEVDGLVKSEEEHHGVGRPRKRYSLTEKGREKFPTRYIRFTVRLLEQLKENSSPDFIQSIFKNMANAIASDYQEHLKDLAPSARIDFVQRLLYKEGFCVEIEKKGNYYFIRESCCPYYHVGRKYPEICSFDETLISTLLNLPTQKYQCILHGDPECTYVVSADPYINPVG